MIRTAGWFFILGACCLFSAAATAQELNKESTREALNVYTDAANFQNAEAFELASEEWQKFLTKFPKDPLVPKVQYYAGVCYLKQNKLEKAAEAFGKVVSLYPKFEQIEDAYLNYGWCQYQAAQASQKAEDYAKSEATFDAMLKAHPETKYADQALFFLGESLYLQGKKEPAVAAYDKLVKNHEKSKLRVDALYALGVTQEELKQYAAAGATYDLFLAAAPESDLVPEVRMRKAETVLQAGQFAEAEKMFAEVAAIEGFPSADHALYRQAYCATKQNNDEAAGTLYAKIAADFPNSSYASESILAAARSFYRAEKYDDSAKWFTQVLEKGGENGPEAAHWICRIHLRKGEAQQAADLAAKTLPTAAESPYLVKLKMDQADALYKIEAKKAESVDLYAKIATDHPDHEDAPDALYYAAFGALEQKKYEPALAHAEAFLKAYPEDGLAADVKNVLAESALQLKKYEQAEAGFRDLLAGHADHKDAELWKVRLGLCLHLQKKHEEAITALSAVLADIKTPSRLAEANYLLGVSQFQLNKYAEASTALSAALAADPKWPQADEGLLYLARSQNELNQTPQAIGTLDKLLADFPKSSLLERAHFWYGEFAYKEGDFAKAASEYEATLAAAQEGSTFIKHALYGKGWSQLKTKAYGEGEATFASLIEKYPEDKLAKDSLFARAMCRRQIGLAAEEEKARTAALTGAIEDAKAYLASGENLTYKSNALYEQGLAQVALKQPAEAEKTFSTLLKEDPQYASTDNVLYELAWALKLQDKNEEALARFAELTSAHADSYYAAEAFFHVAEGQYEAGKYDEAIKSYGQSLTKSKTNQELGSIHERAAYKLGYTQYKKEDYEAALAAFVDQLTSHPQGEFNADARFMKGECLFKQEKYGDALLAYQEALKSENHPEVNLVLIHLHAGQSAAQEKKWEESVKLLTPIVEKHSESAYVDEARYEIGWAQQNLNKPEAALAYYEEASKSRGEVGARSRFMAGELYFAQKDFDAAIAEFQRAMFGYGAEQAPKAVKNWQAKSGYEAGRCAEVQIQGANPAARAKLIKDATRFYGFVVEKHPEHELAAEAKKRLEALSKL